MRAISTDQQGVLDAGVQAEHCRVSIKDSGGVFRDLTTYPGFNAVKVAKWSEQIDSPHPVLTVTLARELYRLSLSPLVAASAVNKGFDPSASSSALIAINREVKVEVAVVAMDKQPGGSDWMEVFRGRVDTLDAAKGEDIELTARGLSGRLAQQFIKTELVYSYAADGGVAKPLRIWEPQIPVTTSPLTYGLPASRADATTSSPAEPGFNKFLKCSQAGTTGATEPVWTTGAGQVDGSAKWDYVGAPTTSGRPVEEVIQNILDDNKGTGDPTVTLYTPSSPGWNIRQFIQQRTFTLDAIRALATQIGWDIRYKWRSGTGQFEMTLYAPTRSSPSVDHTFATADYGQPTRLAIDIGEIRNSIRVIYADRADLWPDTSPKRKVVEVSDSSSIAKYGELWMEIQEDQTSNIDSSTEATTLANNALSDCKEPTAELAVPLARGFPWVELNDFYTFSADGVRFDSDQSLAVVGWDQTYQADQDSKASLKTQLQLRGLPTIGAAVHIEKAAHPKNQPPVAPHQRSQFQGPKTPGLSFSDVVGGTKISLGLTKDKNQLLAEYEIHVYPTPGTPLDATTLIGLTKNEDLVAPNLIPGNTYYARIVPRWTNAGRLVRSQPSAEVSFVAARAQAGHLDHGPWWGRQPLNGGFEDRTDPSAPPDHWLMAAGAWGTDVLEVTGSDVRSGNRCLRIKPNAASADIRSNTFQVEQGRYYEVSWFFRDADGGTGSIELYIKTYSDDGVTQVNDISLDLINSTSDPSIISGLWQRRGTVFQLTNTNDRYARIGVRKLAFGGASSSDFRFDNIEIKPKSELVQGQQTTSVSKTLASGTSTAFGSEANVNLESEEVGPGNIGFNDVQVWFAGSCYTDVASTGVEFFPRLTDLDGTVFDGTPVRFFFNNANEHHAMAGCWTLPRPQNGSYAGTHVNVKMMWRRFTGTGQIIADSNDSACFVVK